LSQRVADLVEQDEQQDERRTLALEELGGRITKVQGTGLLFSCELDTGYKCYGVGSTEEYLRERGLGVIHGGVNSLRFTPHFAVASDEIDLVVAGIRDALLNGPRKTQDQAQAQAA
jgi:acetylornithine/succinyldiaminopimelate/putrescine aminotransferase